jgi:N-methylhydantoinase A
LYGYCFRDRPEQQVEWVNLRVTGVGSIRRPALRAAPTGTPAPPTGERPVCFEVGAGYQTTPVYWRPGLTAGTAIDGPAVIEEYGSTVPLHPGFTATVDDLGNLVVVRKGTLLTPGVQQGALPDTGAGEGV